MVYSPRILQIQVDDKKLPEGSPPDMWLCKAIFVDDFKAAGPDLNDFFIDPLGDTERDAFKVADGVTDEFLARIGLPAHIPVNYGEDILIVDGPFRRPSAGTTLVVDRPRPPFEDLRPPAFDSPLGRFVTSFRTVVFPLTEPKRLREILDRLESSSSQAAKEECQKLLGPLAHPHSKVETYGVIWFPGRTPMVGDRQVKITDVKVMDAGQAK